MRRIDTKQLSKTINDTLIHRQCVIRSGNYLAQYLIKHSRSVDAIRLIGRCQIHDMSKLTYIDEFMALASIIDTIEQMGNINHVQSEEEIEAKYLHWKRNSHHPEHGEMTDLDLMEMACDCHARSKQFGTNLMDFIEVQQEKKYHFNPQDLRRLKHYCLALCELSKNDDYSSVLNPDNLLTFDFKDSTLAKLEVFDDSCYPDNLKTDRLYLQKMDNPDFASIVYFIYLKDEHDKIGEVSVKFNGYLEYKIYQKYLAQGYGTEALRKIIEVSKLGEVLLSVRKDNEPGKGVAEELGFNKSYTTENSEIYSLKLERKE